MFYETDLKECEVVIKIPETTEDAHRHIFKALDELSKAGIHFDTGCGCGAYDWEFDWSLKGAKVYFKKFSDGKLPSGKPIKDV